MHQSLHEGMLVFLLGEYLGVALLGCTVCDCLTFQLTAKQLSKVVAPFYTHSLPFQPTSQRKYFDYQLSILFPFFVLTRGKFEVSNKVLKELERKKNCLTFWG